MADLAVAFGEASPPEPIETPREATPPAHDRMPPSDLVRSTPDVGKGHGRIETRRLAASRGGVAHLDRPGAARMCRLERTREKAGVISPEVACALTSLSPERAPPDRLLPPRRDHRLIEHRLHRRRDTILREDHSPIRSGTGPRAGAALRDTMPAIIPISPSPTDLGEICAENRLEAIAAARRASFERPWRARR